MSLWFRSTMKSRRIPCASVRVLFEWQCCHFCSLRRFDWFMSGLIFPLKPLTQKKKKYFTSSREYEDKDNILLVTRCRRTSSFDNLQNFNITTLPLHRNYFSSVSFLFLSGCHAFIKTVNTQILFLIVKLFVTSSRPGLLITSTSFASRENSRVTFYRI